MSAKLLKILTVTGNGVEKIENTLAKVGLGIEIIGITSTEVQDEIAKKSSVLVDLLRSQNVDQLKTTGITLRNYRRYMKKPEDPIEYIGTNTISFCVPVNDVGLLLDETIKAGASRIDRVDFMATPEATSIAKQKALRKATIDAKTKAEVVLNTLDFILKDVINIEVDQIHFKETRNSRRRRASRRSSPGDEDSSGSESSVVGGEQTVSASVSLQISY